MTKKGTIQPGEVRNPYGRKGKPKANNHASSLTPRAQLSKLAGQHFGGERDLYEVMGYPRHLTPEDYADDYLRQDIAARIVDAYPDATWREHPEVKGEQSFAQAWSDMDRKHAIWRTFHRLDRLTGMGHYGVLLFGLDGGEDMATPAMGTDYNLLYLQPHSERTAQVTRWEDDPQSPRYGLPVLYRITTGTNWTGAGAGQKSMIVHHSRVIHVAERALEDISIGTPRLERIYNRLMDLDKLLGGSAEMYWQNVAMMMAFLADADSDIQPEDRDAMKDQFEEMQHGLRRFLTLQGTDAKNLAPGLQGSDPGSHIDKQIEIIAGASGIPKRILMGSESGELASSQDENNWASRISERREQFAGPTIVEAFIGKCQRLGVLPSGFNEIEWPEADTMGETGRAEIADKKAGALQKYLAANGGDLIVSPDEFRAWLGEGPLQQEEADDLDEEDAQVVSMMERRGKR